MSQNEQLRLNRVAALEAAVELHATVRGDFHLFPGVDAGVTFDRIETEVRHTAETFAAWLYGTSQLVITQGPIINQQTGDSRSPSPAPGDTMAQIHDNEDTSFIVEPKDPKGFPTSGDAITWDINPDDGSVVTKTVSADGLTLSVSAVAPGTVTGRVTDASANGADGNPLSASFTVDVVTAGTATIDIQQGPVTVQGQ